MYRFWYGPVVGLTVSHIWEGYGGRLFINFGRLRPSGYVRRDGSPGEPRGEFELTNMDSMSDWKLFVARSLIRASNSGLWFRRRCIPILRGRRLQRFEIEETSRSTRLTFSEDVVLTTKTYPGCRDRTPHWSLRYPGDDEDHWRYVSLTTASEPPAQ